VLPFVLGQRAAGSEPGQAHLALEGLVAGVGAGVRGELRLSHERVRAQLALKALRLRVTQLVLAQIRVLGEALSADIA